MELLRKSWRPLVYGFVAAWVLMAVAERAYAFEVTKPAGTPEIFLPDYNLSVAVFAVTSPVGSGLVVGEQKPNGKYEVCGVCSRFVIDLAGEIAFKGGEVQYIEGMRGEVNTIFAQRYPALSGPVGNTPLERLNYALGASFRLTGSGLQPR